MLDTIKKILEIQEFDIKMIQLMRIKRQRQKELTQIESLRKELHQQLLVKEEEITALTDEITIKEARIEELVARLKELEVKQSGVKKVDEFNALTQEMTTVERQKASLENIVSDSYDKKSVEEELLTKIRDSLSATESSSREIENEILASIRHINEEGSKLKERRDVLAAEADAHTLAIYERLLRNKKDRVVVPIENRTCSGCHIALTPQHENLVRKGDNIVFCEHCSRIHFWQENEDLEAAGAGARRRRRRASV